MGFESVDGVIVDLADPLARQAQPLTDFLPAVALEVNRKKYLLVPVIKYLSDGVTELESGLQREVVILWIVPFTREYFKNLCRPLTVWAYPVSIAGYQA